jgi:streptomycin 6-kinase
MPIYNDLKINGFSKTIKVLSGDLHHGNALCTTMVRMLELRSINPQEVSGSRREKSSISR